MAKKVVKKQEKKTYEIDVVRIGIASKTIEVKAKSRKEAEKLALKKASEYEFREHDAEYKLE